MWYVVQVVGGQEHAVIEQIEKLVSSTTYKSCFIPLADDEKTIISAFIGDTDHVMKMSEGIINGDEVVILKGPLMNHLGLVKKIDRHKRLAYLELKMCGRPVTIKAGLEIVKKY